MFNFVVVSPVPSRMDSSVIDSERAWRARQRQAPAPAPVEIEEVHLDFQVPSLPPVEGIGGFYFYGGFGPFDSFVDAVSARAEHVTQLAADAADDLPPAPAGPARPEGAGKLPNGVAAAEGWAQGAKGVTGHLMVRKEPRRMGAKQRNVSAAFAAAGIRAGMVLTNKALKAALLPHVPCINGVPVVSESSLITAWVYPAGQAGWLEPTTLRGEWRVSLSLFGIDPEQPLEWLE